MIIEKILYDNNFLHDPVKKMLIFQEEEMTADLLKKAPDECMWISFGAEKRSDMQSRLECLVYRVGNGSGRIRVTDHVNIRLRGAAAQRIRFIHSRDHAHG